MEDKITAILKDEFLSADIADQDLNANLGNVVKIVEKDYNRIDNKPQINGVTLQGDKSALELGLVPTDLSKLEAVEQPIKSVRQTADMFVDNGGKPSKIALQQVKDMATKVVYANELGNVDFEKLDVDDYVILGDKIYRVVDVENNIKQLLPETSAEHVTFADKKGGYTSTNVEDALTEIAETVAENNGKLASEIRGVGTLLTNHKNDKDNPHGVTKTQVGLGNVDNTADLDKPISTAQETVNAEFKHNFKQLNSDIDTLGKGLNERIDATNSNLTALRESTESALSNQQESINDIDSTLNSHITNQNNPHNVTKAQVGLDKVDNTADVDKSVKEAKKATNDGVGNNIVDTYASKQYVQEGLAGKNRSIAFEDYQAFVTAVNGYSNTTLKVSDNVFVKTLGVPDMWVTAVNSEKATYTYTNDQAIINALDTTSGLTVGYFSFSKLETEKVDLSTYQTKTDNTLETTSKTVVGAINEVKGTADNALSKANANAGEISQIKDGTTKVKEAEHADTTDNATNVTTNINGKAISSIFETNGTTAKEATHAGKATSADKATQADSASKVANNLTFSGQNAQGTESTIGFDGSQAQEVAFNGDDFVATKGRAFEVSIAPSGATAGTYNNVTIDGKGRVTAGKNIDYATMAQVNAKYTKPESGIPKSDLASSVQTSLDKADTALQSAPVTSVNGKTGDVTLGAGDVGALPSSTKFVSSVNGETGAVTGIATKDELNAKQNTLTDEQLAAVNSGITEAKRAKYDGYETTINRKANSADLAQVATSGSYNDLSNKPAIPTDYVKYTAQTLTDAQKSQARSNIGAGTSNFSGNYNDLTNKPTIPTIPTNYVTIDTAQTISGKKTFTNDMVVNKSTPNINVVHTGLESGTNPTATVYSNLNFGDKNGKNLSVVRSQVISNGRVSTDLWIRSFGTGYGNYVGFFASPNATSGSAEGVWHFSPNLNAKHDLGNPNLKWRKGYIQNIIADNIPFDSNGLSTGTLGSTKLPSTGRYYIECSNVSYSILRKELVSCVLDFNNAYCSQSGINVADVSATVPYYYYIEVTDTGIVSITTYQASDNATLDSSGSKEITGTFKYKKID